MSQDPIKQPVAKQPATSNDNPYIDNALMDAYINFSPAENKKYLEQHGSTQPTTDVSTTTLQTDQPPPPPYQLPNMQYDNDVNANSQDILNEHIGIPINNNNSDPLSIDEIKKLQKGDNILLYDEDDNGNIDWIPYKFINIDENGMINLENTKKEVECVGCVDDDDIPAIYKMDDDNDDNDNNVVVDDNKATDNDNDTVNYNIGDKIFLTTDIGMTPYIIKSYDINTTKAQLEDMSGDITQCFLRGMNIQMNDNSKSSQLAITQSSTEWTWIPRTHNTKLEWISYKNTLLGSISVSSAHLYPISLDYMTLMFVSGLGLSFSWYSHSLLSSASCSSEHMDLFLGSSQIDDILYRITKYSAYKFNKIIINKDDNNSLYNIENNIISSINNNICTITHDNIGHLGLIVGYRSKQLQTASIHNKTRYLFKFKKFGTYSCTNNKQKQQQYNTCDLANKSLIIQIIPPKKDKINSIKHIFNPLLLYNIITDLIDTLNIQNKVNSNDIELYGINAFNRMISDMDEARKMSDVSFEFAQITIFALIRLFDSRKSVIDFIDYIDNKIQSSFHSNTGADKEWKFIKSVDISSELKIFKQYLEKETNEIRKLPLFDKYIAGYNGSILEKIEWEPFHRSQIKSALELIIKYENNILNNLCKIQNKLKIYCDNIKTV